MSTVKLPKKLQSNDMEDMKALFQAGMKAEAGSNALQMSAKRIAGAIALYKSLALKAKAEGLTYTDKRTGEEKQGFVHVAWRERGEPSANDVVTECFPELKKPIEVGGIEVKGVTYTTRLAQENGIFNIVAQRIKLPEDANKKSPKKTTSSVDSVIDDLFE